MNAKDAILYLYDKGLLNIDAIMKNKDSIMQELDNTTEKLTKHDPTRLFKKGDRVRIKREINGRIIHHSFAFFEYDTIYTVKEDEVQKSYKSGHVSITDGNGNICTLSFYELELVTPVEELEPYSVEESCGGANLHCFILKRRKKHLSYYLYKAGNANHYYTREQAKAAAEAERDRLNEEWRKEQNNG